MKEFYNNITKLNYIVRYSNTPRIKDETVAVHSFMVAAIILKLHDEYYFNLERAVLLAICHDIPEYDTNDVSHITKKKYPQIRELLKKAEREALETMPLEVASAFAEYAEQETVEAKITHLADILQCSQYAGNEVQLGNVGHMQEVVELARLRDYEMRLQLKKYRRKKNEEI